MSSRAAARISNRLAVAAVATSAPFWWRPSACGAATGSDNEVDG